MWLLDARTYVLRYFLGTKDLPRYAILSHTWGQDEVTFQDVQDIEKARSKDGFRKIMFTCRQALDNGLEYAWIDTCCIDKSSSAELSEAINSMFRWYQNATSCYVYMSDVSNCGDICDDVDPEDKLAGVRHSSTEMKTSSMDQSLIKLYHFRRSRWFTRGWTLQELLAPRYIEFRDAEWNLVGTLPVLLMAISDITGIATHHILASELEEKSCPFAVRMSWASKRHTTREEDMAYSLLGLCNVNMPLLYGEGIRAFRRLQEEILKKSTGHDLLAWHTRGVRHELDLSRPDTLPLTKERHIQEYAGQCSLLAPSPAAFHRCAGVRPRSHKRFMDPAETGLDVGFRAYSPQFDITNAGLRIHLPVIELRMPPRNQLYQLYRGAQIFVAALRCIEHDSAASEGLRDATIGLLLWSPIPTDCRDMRFFNVVSFEYGEISHRTVLIRNQPGSCGWKFQDVIIHWGEEKSTDPHAMVMEVAAQRAVSMWTPPSRSPGGVSVFKLSVEEGLGIHMSDGLPSGAWSVKGRWALLPHGRNFAAITLTFQDGERSVLLILQMGQRSMPMLCVTRLDDWSACRETIEKLQTILTPTMYERAFYDLCMAAGLAKYFVTPGTRYKWNGYEFPIPADLRSPSEAPRCWLYAQPHTWPPELQQEIGMTATASLGDSTMGTEPPIRDTSKLQAIMSQSSESQEETLRLARAELEYLSSLSSR